MFSTARYSSYSWCSRWPQYSVPLSVSTRNNGISCSSKNGSTQSLSRSAATRAGLAVIQFGEGNLGVSIEKRLLIDTAYALDGADVVRVLGAEIAGMRGLDLAV